MNREEIESQKSIERMLSRISRRRGGVVSKSTKDTFLYMIGLYSDFLDLTPDEIMAQRKVDLRSDEEEIQRSHEEKVTGFAKYLVEEFGYKRNSIATAIGAVQSLYTGNYMPLVDVGFSAGDPERQYKMPTKAELSTAIEAAKAPWHAAYMIFTKDCGISPQDMLALRPEDGSQVFGSLKQQLKEGRAPVHLHLTREKTLHTFDTFLGEDCYQFLDGVNLEGPRIFPYTDSAIQIVMKDIGVRFGWSPALSFCPYSLRKWFRTQLTLDDVNESLVEYMMGHRLARTKAAYLAPPPEALVKVYDAHYSALRLKANSLSPRQSRLLTSSA